VTSGHFTSVHTPTHDELTALDALGQEGAWHFDGHDLRLTNLDMILFSAREDADPVTKRDLIRYHACIAPHMLPYLEGRAVNPHRYPNGASKPGFWHKARPDHAPDFVRAWHYPDADPDETQVYSAIDNPAAFVWMANYGALELNPWTSRIDSSHEPTWALIDIDPGTSTSLQEVLVLARLYRAALQARVSSKV